MNLPYQKHPCKDCPFRKDAHQGWLGEKRMAEILSQSSFTCHKTPKSLQCAGHMIIKGDQNSFVSLAKAMKIPAPLSGEELIFSTKEDCINHHK
mgnify:CR=1 FL=1